MNELTHYGVKGQKWGVRRKRKAVDRVVDKAYKKSDQYGVKADKAITKQQKLQGKRFNKINKLRQQGKIDEANKYSIMSDKENKLWKQYINYVNKHVSLKEFAYAYDIDMSQRISDVSKEEIKRGRDAIETLSKR